MPPPDPGPHSPDPERGKAAFLIDLFDTLVLIDGEIYAQGRRAMAARLGVCDFDFNAAWRASGRDAQTGVLKTTADRCARVMSQLQKGHDPHFAATLAHLDVEFLLKAAKLYPGAKEFLAEMNRRFEGRVALVSNAAATGRDVVRALGIGDDFAALIFSCELGVMKPKQEIYDAALKAVGGDAAGSWFLGDGATRELEGARDAGLKPLRIDHPLKLELLRGNPLVDPTIPAFTTYEGVIEYLDRAG